MEKSASPLPATAIVVEVSVLSSSADRICLLPGPQPHQALCTGSGALSRPRAHRPLQPALCANWQRVLLYSRCDSLPTTQPMLSPACRPRPTGGLGRRSMWRGTNCCVFLPRSRSRPSPLLLPHSLSNLCATPDFPSFRPYKGSSKSSWKMCIRKTLCMDFKNFFTPS